MKRRRHKFGAIRTGKYASRYESSVADALRAELAAGETLLEQVPVRFACGAKLVVDFAVERDGKTVRYIEAKGMSTAVFKLKMRMLKHEHPEIFGRLEVRKSPRALKYEESIKRKAKKTRDAKKGVKT